MRAYDLSVAHSGLSSCRDCEAVETATLVGERITVPLFNQSVCCMLYVVATEDFILLNSCSYSNSANLIGDRNWSIGFNWTHALFQNEKPCAISNCQVRFSWFYLPIPDCSPILRDVSSVRCCHTWLEAVMRPRDGEVRCVLLELVFQCCNSKEQRL